MPSDRCDTTYTFESCEIGRIVFRHLGRRLKQLDGITHNISWPLLQYNLLEYKTIHKYINMHIQMENWICDNYQVGIKSIKLR